MRLYRLASRRHAGKLDGGGNRDHGARWNSGRGRGVVYASFSLATSILEMMVHFGPSQRVRLPKNIMLVEIEAPDDAGVETVRQEDIPKASERLDETGRTWRQRRGDEWLDQGSALILCAPSVVSPTDQNAMLNPSHPRMQDVELVRIEPFRFDPRLAFPS